MTSESPSERPPGQDETLRNIIDLVESLRGIQEIGVAQYTPVVENIIGTRCRDARHIQHMLDHLLDYACHPSGLELFKKLCRYYWTLDPAATADYVGIYREMWDSDESDPMPPATPES
jgi:hypothetical protein